MKEDISLEERRKKIEKFMESNMSSGAGLSDNSVKKEKDNVKVSIDNKEECEFNNFYNKNPRASELLMEDINRSKKTFNLTFLLFIVVLVLGYYFIFKGDYSKNIGVVSTSVFEEIKIEEIRDPAQKDTNILEKEINALERKLQMKDATLEKLKADKKYLEKQLSIIENQKKELINYSNKLQKVIETRTQETEEVEIKSKPVEKKDLNSKVWEIIDVKNGNQVTVRMINTDRTVVVSIGDSLSDVGEVTSLKNQNNKWTVVGSKKNIVE